MTKSPRSAPKTSPEKSASRHPWLLIIIFRLLLLGVGGGVALILGIVLAIFYPNPNPERPLMLKLLEPSEHKTPAAYPSPSSTVVPASTNTALQLTPVQKQQAQTELAQLQGQLKTLSDGVAALESQVGISGSDEAIEARLQAIAMELEGVSPASANSQSVENSAANPAVAVSESISQTDKLKVTLPSDLLFDRSNSILRSEAGLILDKIVADLRGYPSSTIRIGAYTDTNGEAEDNRELSFRRAKAVEQYLARTLGTQYRWLVIGYGETRPLVANDTGANQQRNRRVEIAVD